MESEARDEDAHQDSFEAIGAELASARLERGLQIAELAQHLRISRHYLKHLEAGDFDSLPGATYVSGYIRSLAREVGLDPVAMTQRYRALLDDKAGMPSYQFPVNNQQPQRSGAMIASIIVIFAVGGYGGRYAAGKPDLLSGLLGPGTQETAAIPQVETTVTEPDNLVSGDTDDASVAFSEAVPASASAEQAAETDMAAGAAPADDAGAAQPSVAAVELAAGQTSTPQTGIAAAGEGEPDGMALAASAPDAEAPAGEDALAARGGAATGSPVLVEDDAGDLASLAGSASSLSTDRDPDDALSAIDATGLSTPVESVSEVPSGDTAQLASLDGVVADEDQDSTVAGSGQAVASRATADDEPLAGSGVAFARQRLPELEITVRATGVSWVEIIRNDGEEVMAGLMRNGETYIVDSRDRLYLSTGNAGGLELVFNDGTVRGVGESGEILRDLLLDATKLRNQF